MTRAVPLSRGLVALVDDADFDRVIAAGPWHARPSGSGFFYASHTLNGGRKIHMHSMLTGWPLTDHINGDGLDNRRSNLRPATHSQNIQNSRSSRVSQSGYRGVTRLRGGTWRAVIQVGGKRLSLGCHPSAQEAARAYDAAAVTNFGEFARLNFPEEQVA